MGPGGSALANGSAAVTRKLRDVLAETGYDGGVSSAPSILIGGKYRTVRVVGEGAMGVVFEAIDPAGQAVAVKTLVRTDPEGLARFAREVSVCARIAHPNVMPVFDHGFDAELDAPYFAMPLLRGGDLAVHLAHNGALPVDVAVPLIIQACEGVAAAHQAGVIHRDIKPSNLILDDVDGRYVLRVADFGLARTENLEGNLTRSGVLMGTPRYISPEQSQNPKATDARTDVWALGMVLYHMLAGTPAFGTAGAFMAFLVQKKELAPIQQVAPWVPGPVARVLHAALLRDVEARIPMVAELILGLEMVVGYDMAHRALGPSDLAQGISAEARAVVAPRVALPYHWEELLRS